MDVEDVKPEISSDSEDEDTKTNIWKTETYRTAGNDYKYQKKVLVAGSGWKHPKEEEVTYIEYTVLSGESDGELYHTDNYSFVQVDKLGSQFFTPFVGNMKRDETCLIKATPATPAVQQMYDLVPSAKESDLYVRIKLKRWDAIDYTGPDYNDKAVKMTLLQDGENNYKTPNDGSWVIVDVVGSVDGQEFINKTKFMFTLGDDDLASWITEGLEYGLKKMKRRERSRIQATSSFNTTGVAKSGDMLCDIPANVAIDYEVFLHDFSDVKQAYELSNTEKVTAAMEQKDKGNEMFKANRIDRALKRYERGEKLVEYAGHAAQDEHSAEVKDGKELRRTLRLNIAQCHIKQNRHKKALEYVDLVLKADPFHHKALYRKALCLMGTGDYDEAYDILIKLPRDNAVDASIKTCRKCLEESNAKAKNVYSKMFA